MEIKITNTTTINKIRVAENNTNIVVNITRKKGIGRTVINISKNIEAVGYIDAHNTVYNNIQSGLSANNVQDAFDEISASIKSAANISSFTAGSNLTSGQAIAVLEDGKAYVYDVSNLNHYGLFAGIAVSSALTGGEVRVCHSGVCVDVGSGWVQGRVYYVGSNGLLTTVPVQGGLVLEVGKGINIDTILINSKIEIISL
jgi:hypothetical protein